MGEKISRTRIAVYGSLLKGFGNHRLIQDSKYIGDGLTKPEYTMVSLGGFPGVIKNGNNSIYFQVYELDDETFKRVDRLEGHPAFYKRDIIETEYGDVWMYFLDESYLEHEKVESGNWLKYKNEREYQNV